MSKQIRICSNREMREIDKTAEEKFGIGPEILMENAGRAAAETILKEFPRAGKRHEILVFAGKGNNAGDAFVVARQLLSLGRKVRVFQLTSPAAYKGATKKNFEILSKMQPKLTRIESIQELEGFFEHATGPFFAIDGILGTGLTNDLQGIFYDSIKLINHVCDKVVALDIPSGVCGDTGRIRGTAIKSNLTVSFGFPKLGHFLAPGAAMRGKLVNLGISLPNHFAQEGEIFLLTGEYFKGRLKHRDRYSHKNSFGHVVLAGGTPGRLGAITLSARAAHKVGAGLVTVAGWPDSYESLLLKVPDETMVHCLNVTDEGLERDGLLLKSAASMVVGPGLGVRPEGKKLLEAILYQYSGPLVLDADALNLVSEHNLHSLLMKRQAPTVLTPHPGEMARMLKKSKEEVVNNPVEAIQECVNLTGSIVLLKGPSTILCSPEHKLFLNHAPNDGMATAGSGDVLAGIIGGLLGQGEDPYLSTQLGVFLHSLAGAHAASGTSSRSMSASDIVQNIPNAWKTLESERSDHDGETPSLDAQVRSSWFE